MEILIIISGAIAIGLLIATLFSTSRELNEKSGRLEIAESRLAGLIVGPETTGSGNESERLVDLEKRVSLLSGERDQLLAEVQNLKRDSLANPGINQNYAEAEDRLRQLRDENTHLRNRVETLEEALARGEQARIPELEQQMAKLRQEHAQSLSQIDSLAREKRASQARIQEFESVQSKVSSLESNLVRLRDENSRLAGELVDFKNSLQEKLKSQLNSLQELYHDIQSRDK
jgi:chromosome segregation ATPase